jgi:hypothetical protein
MSDHGPYSDFECKPQGLQPGPSSAPSGTATAVPFPNAKQLQSDCLPTAANPVFIRRNSTVGLAKATGFRCEQHSCYA